MTRPRLPRPRVWHPYAVWGVAVAAIAGPWHLVTVAVVLYVFGLAVGPRTLHAAPTGTTGGVR